MQNRTVSVCVSAPHPSVHFVGGGEECNSLHGRLSFLMLPLGCSKVRHIQILHMWASTIPMSKRKFLMPTDSIAYAEYTWHVQETTQCTVINVVCSTTHVHGSAVTHSFQVYSGIGCNKAAFVNES